MRIPARPCLKSDIFECGRSVPTVTEPMILARLLLDSDMDSVDTVADGVRRSSRWLYMSTTVENSNLDPLVPGV
jgi:hypothetical protein